MQSGVQAAKGAPMTNTPPDEETIRVIGVEGYTYLYPLVLMDVTRRQLTNVRTVHDVPMRAPRDTFFHAPAFPAGDFRAVVRPNFDTLYSAAFLDVHEEPRIVSLPDAGDKYYLLPLYDMWGEVFSCPGTRTTGNAAIDVAVCPPGWSGQLPAGVRRYEAPTPWVWVIGRTEASPATYAAVHEFQAGMTITPLSAWGGAAPTVTGEIDPSVDDETPPLRQVFALDAAAFFGRAAELIAEHPPHQADYPILDRLARIGFVPGEPFDLAAADPAVRAALQDVTPEARKRISDEQSRLAKPDDGWVILRSGMGTYGSDFLRRACVELIGLGANLAEDAIYPVTYVDSDGNPFTGAERYVWHFEKDAMPPVRAFWSLTLYDPEGFQVPNELDRFAIGDRDDLRFNSDGSLDLVVSHTRPEEGTSNWLPAPEGVFNLCARFYYPEQALLDGRWTPPPVRRV
ncbi:DUF1254 domain-containing protein [Pseudonocardia benzenivorans]